MMSDLRRSVMSSSEASSSKSPKVFTPSVITQVNDSLYELYKPPGTPSLQILFFHGLQLGDYSNAHVSTWESADGSCIWPQTWLVEDFPDAHVLTVAYSGAMNQSSIGNIDMYIIVENLLSDLMDNDIGQVPYCPVILVGHSIGGLVIKALCYQAQAQLSTSHGYARARLEKFLGNMRGLFFYATPHRGSEYAIKLAKSINSTLLTFFTTLSKDAARLNHEFNSICKLHERWLFAGLGETLPIRLPPRMGLSETVLIVPEASAREYDFNVVEEVDHFSICKPRAKRFRNFTKLKGFLNSIMVAMKEEAEHPQNYQLLPESIVGIDAPSQQILGELAKFQTLGLFGMGGLGKTTLAKATFNAICKAFDYTCFIPNVKKIEGEVESLKREVGEQMHYHGKRVGEEWDFYKLRGKKLLLVLDDISSMRDIAIMLNLVRETSSESRFIVTSREGLLEKRLESTHHVSLLTRSAARELFLHHAFSEKTTPPRVLEKLVDAIVSKCDGLPLGLEVLGNYLYTQENHKEWEQTLHALETGDFWSDIEKRLWAVLRISYNGLNEKEQQIFLDATTFFSNTTWTLSQAKASWRVIYGLVNVEQQWRTLVELSLVHNVKDDESILVHEQLQSLGRIIASEPANNGKRRVWDGNLGIEVLTTASSATEQEILALHLGSWDNLSREIHISSSALRRLQQLQYLEVRGEVVVDCARSESFPTKLVLLSCTASKFCRALFHQTLRDRLVVFKLEGPCESSSLPCCLATDPQSKVKSKLEDLPSLPGSLTGGCPSPLSFPFKKKTKKSLPWRMTRSELDQSRDPKYDSSSLPCCRGLHLLFRNRIFGSATTDMLSILGTIGKFSRLEFLDLQGCGCVGRLPETFGQLLNLKHLTLSAFRNLHTLPESFGELSSLTSLRFNICNFKALPKSFGQLQALCDLEFFCCDEFHTLPESFGRLEALSHLKFLRCSKLTTLPESFGHLKALNLLAFEYCRGLHTLPESFGDLKGLGFLTFRECSQLGTLPDSFGGLKALSHLKFKECSELANLPGSLGQLKALRHLEFLQCGQLDSLPESFGELEALSDLIFVGCTKLTALPETFGNLTALSTLKFAAMLNNFGRGLESLPDSFGQLKMLRHLELETCRELLSLPESFGGLESLTHLKFEDCGLSGSLPASFGQLKALGHLEFVSCPELSSLPNSFGKLEGLSHLIFRYCSAILSLPETFGELKALRNLEFKGMFGKLYFLPESFGQLRTLSHLEFDTCHRLRFLPKCFGQLESLRHLKFRDCHELGTLPESFGQLRTLSHLEFERCPQLHSVPESFGQLRGTLHHLKGLHYRIGNVDDILREIQSPGNCRGLL